LTLFDLIALSVILVSAGIGFVRGAVREVMTILAFVLAALIAAYGLKLTGPFVRKMVDPDWFATTLAVILTFIGAYIGIRMAGSLLTQKLHRIETLGLLDRSAGVAFGLIRALFFLGVFNLVFNIATPAERVPKWISHSALYPLSSLSAKVLRSMAPKGSAVAGKLGPSIANAVREGAADDKKSGSNQNDPKRSGKGYDDKSRRDVDALVEKTR
jgi:membrane protein required for colicin V production